MGPLAGRDRFLRHRDIFQRCERIDAEFAAEEIEIELIGRAEESVGVSCFAFESHPSFDRAGAVERDIRLKPRVVAAVECEHRAEEAFELREQGSKIGVFSAEHSLQVVEHAGIERVAVERAVAQGSDGGLRAGLRAGETVEHEAALGGSQLRVKREHASGGIRSAGRREGGEGFIA